MWIVDEAGITLLFLCGLLHGAFLGSIRRFLANTWSVIQKLIRLSR
jgi:hypothetical protein